MIAALTAYDIEGLVSHTDRRSYPSVALLWEHVGCQQNNRRTARVVVETDYGLEYEVSFSPWTPRRQYTPSERFWKLLDEWCAQERREPADLEGIV